MVARRALLAIVLTAAVALAGCGGKDAKRTSAAPPRVQLALDFTANAVHAPIFAAVRTGRDRANGVSLVIRHPGAGPDALKLVAAGRLDLGVLDIHDLAIAREHGIDVVGVAALVRKPLAALVARPGIRRPRDLEGHQVGVSGLPSDPAFLDAIIGHDGGDLRKVHQVTIGFNAVSGILAGKVDAAPVFWNAEGVALRRRGVKVREFRVEDYGAPAYPEVVLVTARRTLERERDRIRRTLLAIRDGMATVEHDPAAAVRQIAHEAQTTDTGLIAAQLRAVQPIFATDLRLDRRVLDAWADFDARLGIVDRRPDVARAFDFTVLG
jgi:NitT/TauT family transport system substrate-binding protein/putative hydroxymethylpyrimidine transport system substrate-binding protein